MKPFLTAAACFTVFFTGCQTAHTQSGPQVIAVPEDPAATPALATPSPTATATATTTPTPEATASPIATASPSATATPGVAQPHLSYSSCHVDGNYIAMTFDDGPNPKTTPLLLDMLKARGIKATFFMVGQCASENPDIVKRIAAEGHEVGNHSWSHPQLTKLSAGSR